MHNIIRENSIRENSPLRFVSKAVIGLIPVVGWSLAVLGHITFDRKDPESSSTLLSRCAKARGVMFVGGGG